MMIACQSRIDKQVLHAFKNVIVSGLLDFWIVQKVANFATMSETKRNAYLLKTFQYL